MKFTRSVKVIDIKPTTWFALGVVHAVRMMLLGKPLIVTSLNDSKHMVGSKHFSGDAFDRRIWGESNEERAKVVAKAREILDPLGYDIVSREHPQHQSHDHFEYDPKAGEVWIAVV